MMSKILLYSQKIQRSLAFNIGIVIICTISQHTYAQTYSLQISPASFQLDGQNFDGYSTNFTQPYKEVKKEWWRYVNARTIIFNKKTHLVLTVPAKGKESNEPLKFVSQLHENKSEKQSTLKMALVSEGVPPEQLGRLKKQASSVLKDFKVTYYTALIQPKIEEQELISKKISQKMDKYLLNNSKLQMQIEKKPEQKNELAQQLSSNTSEIEKLQSELNTNQKKLTQYKKELNLIK